MSAEKVGSSQRKKLRIAQINILNNEEGEEYRYDFLSYSLQKINADVITVQEVRNSELLREKLFNAGYVHSVFSDKADGGLPYPDGVAVFSKEEYPIVSQQEITFPFRDLTLRNGLIVEFTVNEAPFYVYSGHLAWNMLNESVRLFQAQRISQLAKKLTSPQSKKKVKGKDTVFVMSADLNTGDQSRTYRYLTGLDPVVDVDSKGKIMLNSVTSADNCFFIDSYEFSDRNTSNWETTDQGNNYWGRKTSSIHGNEDYELIPKRRIDYILSYGWQYGKRGCPLNYHRFGNPEPESGFDYDLSDHYGIYSDILV